MANHVSAIKRNRQNKKRQELNRYWKSKVRNISKEVLEACEKKDKAAASKILVKAMSEINKASNKKVIHSNTASRKIARLSKVVSSVA